ncbi:MAG: hypothetical protein WD081_06265 [Gammaproteobacteria bacterium]
MVEGLARRVVADEAQRIPPTAHDADLILGVCDKMHPPLSRLAGTISYRALLSRALVLAKPKAQTLAALRFESDGHLMFDPEHPAAEFLNRDTVRQDAIVLVTEFLNVLMLLIGEGLTVQIIRQVWPEVKIK